MNSEIEVMIEGSQYMQYAATSLNGIIKRARQISASFNCTAVLHW